MSGAFVIAGRLVSPEELDEKVALGDIDRFRADATAGKATELRLFGGPVSTRDIADATQRPEFAPIGIGKPLSIELLTVYTGDAPRRLMAWLTGEPDLLVTSGVRGIETTKPAPRAINQIIKDIQSKQYLEPEAFAEGSPIVYYSPAVAQNTILTSYELVVDTFDHKLFESLSVLFASAGGLPIFAPAAAYLLAGSALSRMFGQLGKALLETPPFLRSALSIKFDSPAFKVMKARNIVLFNSEHQGHFEKYTVRAVQRPSGHEQMRLVDQSGQEYHGVAPYVIASLDGRTRSDLDKFTPTHASAELLEDFYRADVTATTAEVLGAALELYNDLAFRQKAERLSGAIANLPPGSEARVRAEELLKAYKANIRTELLQLR